MARKNPESKGEMSKEEQIGFHKGSLSTLAKEREEMGKILQIVEQLMQMHIKALQDLGVDLQKMAENAKVKGKIEPKGTKKKIDELI
ncbi:MAG: hypothetical protein V1740_07395 [Candidatus Woesearchaeota archaeon]